MKMDNYLILLTKINLKWIRDLNVIHKIVKLLERKQRVSSLTLVLEIIFWI